MTPTAIPESISEKIHDHCWIVSELVVCNLEKPNSKQHQLKRFLELKAKLTNSMVETVLQFQRTER